MSVLEILNISNGPSQVSATFNSIKFEHISHKKISEIQEGSWLLIPNGDYFSVLKKILLSKRKFKVAIGPNVAISSQRDLESIFNNPSFKFLVPSEWVENYFTERNYIPPQQMEVWKAGVDIERWSPSRKNKKRQILIYVKGNEDPNQLKQITSWVDSYDYVCKVIRYGKYSQRRFRKICSQASGAIWIGITESQGIALAQAWAMDVPTLVRRVDKFTDSEQFVISASSAPYLTEETGRFSIESSITKMEVTQFLQSLNQFNPREWVKKNCTIEKSIYELEQIYMGMINEDEIIIS